MRNVMLKLIDVLGQAGLDKLERALMFGAGLLVVLAFVTGSLQMSREWFTFLFRWMHVLSGIMWIGLLWYFNFVQIPSMPKIPDEQKPAIGKVIAPTALFWFRDLGHRLDPGGTQRVSVSGIAARPVQGRKGNLHRLGHVVGRDHGLQRLDDHLAESAKGVGSGGGIRRRKEGRGADGNADQPVQHDVVAADAVLHGCRSEPWLGAPAPSRPVAVSNRNRGRRTNHP